MKKQLILKSAAAVVIGMAAVSCSHDNDVYDAGRIQTEAQENANAQYSSSFAENIAEVSNKQDWKTVSERQAEVTVNLGVDQNYTVAIYSANPLFGGQSSLLALTTVSEGRTAQLKFDAPSTQTQYYVGVFDSKGRGITESATMVNGKITANVGSTAKSRMTRATEAEWTGTSPEYAKTISDYLQWTTAEMEAFTALTNDVLTSYPNGNHTLNDLQYKEGQDGGLYYGNGDGHHYRIPAGVTVTERFNVGDGATLDNVVLYVQGKVVITSANNLNAITLVVAPGGEIEFQGENKMSTTGRFVVAAGGTISGTDGTTFGIENAAPCYNAGTIDFKGTLRVNGSNFYNCGTVNVDVLTGTTKYTTVTNFGQITARTNSIQGESYNGYYINACHLTFTGDAGIGQLTMLNNSRLDVGGQLYISGENRMYTLSEINANSIYWQTATMTGPSAQGEFAVIKSTKFLISHANEINTYNNIYYDIDPEEFYNYQGVKEDIGNNYGNAHHIQGGGTVDPDSEWAQYAEYWCKAPITLWSNEASTTLTIPAGDCTGTGYNDTDPEEHIIPGTGDDPLPVYYSVAFEDLGAIGDFDFNDVVLYVEHNTVTNKANVKFVAAGGELAVDVKYYDDVLFTKDNGTITNTRQKGNVIASQEVDMTVPSTDLLHFSIVVKKDNGVSLFVESAAQQGKAPQALVIPGQWAWPKEQVNIKDAYPNFASWVKDVTNNEWYNEPADGQVIQ